MYLAVCGQNNHNCAKVHRVDQKDKVLGQLDISASQHTLIKWASDKSNSVAGELFTLAHI